MRVVAAVLLVAVGIGVVSQWHTQRGEAVAEPKSVAVVQSEATMERPATTKTLTDRLVAYVDDPVVGGLWDPAGSVERDMEIMSLVFETWQSNFPGLGNPGGENHEITAALMGDNRLKLELIPPDHPAINAAGELCDRWGTPLFFHQLSGEEMELRSAGPDREHCTDDDVLWTP